MNVLKYILSILFVFLILFSGLEAKSIAVFEKMSCLSNGSGTSKKSEQVYRDLIYSNENDKLVVTSYSSVFTLDLSFRDSHDLVDGWKKLDNAGLATLRMDPTWLQRVGDWIDKGLDLTSDGKILNNGTEVGRIVDNNLHVNYSGFGGEIVCDPEKTTTLLGKWKDPACGGTCETIDSRLSKSGQNTGGVNAFSEDIPAGWTPQQIWDNVNEPWLQNAALRGDVIRVVSDPLNIKNIFANTEGIPASVFSSSENLSNYLKNLNDLPTIEKLSFYGREIRHLSKNNYLFDAITKTFVK
jgi:hypothetical protein